jgi:hypothetical protein
MRGILRRRPSPAVVISLVALSVALAGSAYAAIGKNTVRSRQVKNNSLTSVDLRNGRAVKGADVVDGSLSGADIDESTLGLLGAGDVQAFGNASSADLLITSGTFESVLSTSLTAPRDGLLFIVGSISGCDGPPMGAAVLDFRLRLDSTPVDTGIHHEVDSNNADFNSCNAGSTSVVVPVTSGPHTVHLEAAEGSSGTRIIGRDVSVLFVPSGSGVNIPY